MSLTAETPSNVSTARHRRHARHQTIALKLFDATAWPAGFTLAAWARYELDLTADALVRVCAAGLIAGVVHLLAAGLGRRVWGRHPLGSLPEVRVLACMAAGTAAVVLAGLLLLPERPIPASVPPVGGTLALLTMCSIRIVYRYRRDRSLRPTIQSAVPVLLFGLGSAGQALLRATVSDPRSRYLPVGLLDDDPHKQHLRLDGVRVRGGRHDIAAALRESGANTVIFSVANADAGLIREVRAATLAAGATFKVLPPVWELVNRQIGVTDVRDVDINDLLGRRHVVANLQSAETGLAGQRVLVTGAGGSIGSELCRQISRADPAELMMLDRDESALHGLQMSLSGRALLDSSELILADIRDGARLTRIMSERRPDIVFHAAALKHLPLLQRHPGEAVQTNVWGTLAVLEACRGVARFVNISTDKAANPISVLGYSKRITERLTAYAAENFAGTFLSVRFGNVLGSRGSVVTAFQAQIEAGMPVTVTHPDVTRYLMTVQEAVHLVLQSTAIGRDGEALVLDMGRPVRIDDVARQLAAQASQPPRIIYTGLRPGEKLHEELFGPGEVDVRPIHPLISHVPVPGLHPAEVTALDPHADPDKVIEHLARLSTQP